MRRLTAACLLATTALAALAGCTSAAPAGDRAAATARAATSSASGASSSPGAVTSAGAGSGSGPAGVSAWAAKSPQFGEVTQAVIALTTTVMGAGGNTQTVGKACTDMAAKTAGVQPEPGAPQAWTQVLGDLQSISKGCDAVASGDPQAYQHLMDGLDALMTHLDALTSAP